MFEGQVSTYGTLLMQYRHSRREELPLVDSLKPRGRFLPAKVTLATGLEFAALYSFVPTISFPEIP